MPSVLADESTSTHKPLTEEVVVTATRLLRKAEDIAGTVTVITSEEIERQVAVGLEDLTRYEPGISMSTAGRGGNEGFVIRGVGGNRVLTMIDGVRSRDYYSAGPASYGKDAFEVDDLKAVEIIRGPASAIYGADAMGGAVLLRTKNPSDYMASGEDSFLGLRAAGASTDNHYKIGAIGAIERGSWSGLARYTYRDFQEREIKGDAAANPMDGTAHNLLLKSLWEINEQHSLRATFDMNIEEIDQELLSDLSNSVTESNGRDETERYRVDLSHAWQTDVALADQVHTQFFWQRTDGLQHTTQERNSYSFINPIDPTTYSGTPVIRETDFEFNQDHGGLGMMISKELSTGSWDHDMVYGFTWDRTNTERPRNRCETSIETGAETCAISAYPFAPPEVFPNKTFPDTETTRTGIYWQDEMRIGDSGVYIIPGVRWDRYEMDADTEDLTDIGALGYEVESMDEDNVSFNLGGIWDVNETVSLFVQYAEGFRPPNFDEANQAFVNYGFRYAIVPNPELEPETSQGYEVGIRTSFERGYMSLVAYDNHYDDFIDSQYVGSANGISLYQDQNVGEARIYGVEFVGGWNFAEQWELTGNIAYSRGDNETDDQPLDSVEPLTGVLALGYTSRGGRWGADALLTLVDEKTRVSADDRVTADAYALIDLVGHLDVTENARIRFGIFNITDQDYARWANIQGLAADNEEVIALAQEPGVNARIDFSINF